MAEPYYATADELRAKLKVNAEVLPDEEAVELLEIAEDLIDDRLANRTVDDVTGRKVVPADEDDWRIDKLAKATVEVAANVWRDPGIESRQRARSTSGDVSISGVYGPAYGERAQALLNASKLAQPFATTGRRGRRCGEVARRFFDLD